jgi:hypothetical protein
MQKKPVNPGERQPAKTKIVCHLSLAMKSTGSIAGGLLNLSLWTYPLKSRPAQWSNTRVLLQKMSMMLSDDG